MRRVAEQAGCTTMALYTHFAGKDGLLGALFDEGFAELARAQREVPRTSDAVAYVRALCLAYRETAHRFPHHYALMLGRFSGAHTPSAASAAAARQTLDVLVHAIESTRPRTRDRRARAAESAQAIFAFCHGWVSLEALQFIQPAAATERQFLNAVSALLHADALPAPSPSRAPIPR